MIACLQAPSPNFGPRRGGVAAPDLVVLHYTAMDSAEAALERLCDPAAEVSCHYLIGRDGRCWQLVDDAARAWHAGAGSWGGCRDVNSHSIGVELDNDGHTPFAEPLMVSVERLLAEILGRWRIPPHRVIGHADMSPGRKLDPGPRFDWRRLALGGLSCWPAAQAVPAPGDTPDEAVFRADLIAFGYPEQAGATSLLAAFRHRFRPWGRGPLAAEDLALAADLARRFPIDPRPGTA